MNNGRHTKLSGLRRLGEIPPTRMAPEIEQRVVVVDPAYPLDMQMPPRCPKCHADGALMRRHGREVYHPGVLGGCGYTAVMVSKGDLAHV